MITKKEHYKLFCKVDSEGFGYYMLHYGADLNKIEQLGFNREDVKNAIKLFKQLEEKIYQGEQYWKDDV